LLELVANGPETGQRWRRAIPDEQTVRLGRAPRSGWAVPWDLRISREHADLLLQGGAVQVRCLDTALNPVHFRGESLKQFTARPGDEFRIGGTKFRVEKIDEPPASDVPLVEYCYRNEDVERFDFRQADHRLEVLWNLPKIIAISPTDEEFAQRLVALLLDGIPRAEAAAVVQYDTSEDADTSAPLTMCLDSRSSSESMRLRPSRRLILAALERGETLLHIWSDSSGSDSKYTVSGNFDWAFCTPILEQSCKGWCLYVCGRMWPEANMADDLNGDIRFTQFIAKVTGAIRQARLLEAQQAGLRQFFSPKVMKTLSDKRAESLLEPKECDITVLFCDLRGFSRKAEMSQHDLRELLRRCSEALELMTRSILDHDGVIADFLGDAALAFWGWPLPEGPLPACQAALDIQAAFRRARQQPGHPLANFNVGVGIAHGRAIAGKIGTEAQAKVGVFGQVVNLAARLEGMTKQLRVPILIDETIAEYLDQQVPTSDLRRRKLGRIRPYGMETLLMVSQLLPPASQEPAVTDEIIRDYELAVTAVMDGRWEEAYQILNRLPVDDKARDFLMIYLAKHHYEPPSNWNGVIEMASK
jgi:adenylate cyclase